MKDKRPKEFINELAKLCRNYNAELMSDHAGSIILVIDGNKNKLGKKITIYDLGPLVNFEVKIEKEIVY